jgi:Fur family ferric uptake transcriptional regulator
MTRQRVVILDALRSVRTHPTADEIYAMVRKKMPRISLGTVYRNLDLLADSGEILLLERAGAQKHFDGNPSPHQHVLCRKCGRIGDVLTPVAMPAWTGAVAPGFIIEEMRIEFVGLCADCRAESASRAAS